MLQLFLIKMQMGRKLETHLHSSTVCLDVNHITNLYLLFLKAFINGWVKFELLCAFSSLQANYNMTNSLPIACQIFQTK